MLIDRQFKIRTGCRGWLGQRCCTGRRSALRLSAAIAMLLAASAARLGAEDVTQPANAPPPSAPASASDVLPPSDAPVVDGPVAEPPSADDRVAEPPSASGSAAGSATTGQSAPELRKLLELLGVDESHFRSLMDGRPIQPDETEALLKLLYAVRRLPALELRGFVPAAQPLALGSLPPKGSRVAVSGQLRAITTETPPPELAERFELPHYYRCELLLDGDEPAVVYVDVIPTSWQQNPPTGARVGASGILAKQAGEAAGQPTPIVIAPRLAWYPQSPLGDLGMDFGLFDSVRQKRPLLAEERVAFYELLARVGDADSAQLAGSATERLTPTAGGAVAKRLLQDPASEVGKLVLLEGVARRAIRVEVTDPDIRRRFALDHYYEVDLIFRDIRVRYEPAKAPPEGTPTKAADDDTGPLVVTCNLRELPPGMPTGDRISELVRVPAFFFKLWAFQSELAEEAGHHHLQFAPLFLARAATWVPQPPAQSYTWLFSVVLAALLGVVVLVVWGMNRSDRRRRAQVAATRQPAPGDAQFLATLERGGPPEVGS